MFSDLELMAWFLKRMSLILDYYLPPYENFVVIGDSNLSVENSHLEAIIRLTIWAVLSKN